MARTLDPIVEMKLLRMPESDQRRLRRVAQDQWLGVDLQRLSIEDGKAWTNYMFLYREEILARPNN
ncbi:MAG: hypothetical protein JWM68_1931 [Verrucomicrobiales bacterium]|nr:hypothetical protein [Verrucomicrobiales bacterium]